MGPISDRTCVLALALTCAACRGDTRDGDASSAAESSLATVEIAADATEAPALPALDELTPRERLTRLEPGVVSRELIGRCVERTDSAELVARAGACKESGGSQCGGALGPGVVGSDEDGQMAVVSAPWIEPCGGPTYIRVFEATPPWLRPETTTTFGPDDDPVSRGLVWIAGRTRRGFTATPNMVALACELESWTTPLERLAILAEPLRSWMLTISRGRRSLALKLISPSNKLVYELGTIDLGPSTCETEGAARDAPCEREVSAAIDQVVLTPSRRTLVLTARIGPSDPCAAQRVVHQGFRLPDAVAAAMSHAPDHGIQRRGPTGIHRKNE